MILTYLSYTIDIGKAQYPATENTELVQATDRSASGLPYTEDFNVSIGTFTYSFEDMAAADYRDLLTFFVNVVVGRLNEFELTDDRGNNSTVRFTESQLSFEESYLDLWSGSFTVEVFS